MIYTLMTKKAMDIAYHAHHGQTDKTGMPYIFHPFHVAETMTNEKAVTVALLHDVPEDTDITLDDLAAEGFDEDILTALALLTHNPADEYMDYISRLSTCELARQVKLGDLRHNSDVTRLNQLDAPMEARLKKYRKAIELLEAVSNH